MTRRLYRSRSNAMVGGVAAGIAEYFDLDPTLIRLVWVLLLFTGTGLLLYLIAWIVIPPAPEGEPTRAFERTEEIRQQVIETAKDIESEWREGHTTRTAAEQEEVTARRRQALGWILVAIGVLALSQQIFVWLSLDVVWPVVLILLGVFVIVQGTRR